MNGGEQCLNELRRNDLKLKHSRRKYPKKKIVRNENIQTDYFEIVDVENVA